MEYQKHYDNMTERNNLCSIAEGNGYRMLHDDFDEDWQVGDEPHGTLTFTNVPPEQDTEPENPSNYIHPAFTKVGGNAATRLTATETFLESL